MSEFNYGLWSSVLARLNLKFKFLNSLKLFIYLQNLFRLRKKLIYISDEGEYIAANLHFWVNYSFKLFEVYTTTFGKHFKMYVQRAF